ncbi:MAG: tRNA lysidine(34) synthetase TilS [Cyanobacteria bacterium SZAS-4]|nr:tRNA lysidine(34) synthetase TilS [Cyanobacteria bacterium SZAS-4]
MDFHLNTPNQLLAKIGAALNNLPAEVRFFSETVVVVAFSGGPDSTALLLALSMLSKQAGLKVRACHVNHKLRGQDSEDDEQFCRQLCTALSIPLDVYEASGITIEASEANLRATRYDFLFRCAQSANSTHVVLAHNSSDQVETLLFRILRGTSSTGLAGMRTVHLMDNGIWLVRPMLSCARSEVEDFLKLNSVSARLDSSNLSDKFARNFLRNRVIPLCLTRFPTMERQMERLRELVSVDESYMNEAVQQFAEQLGGLDSNTWQTAIFSSAHMALQRRALAKALEFRDIEVSFERVQAILNMMANPSSAKRTTLDHNWDINVSPEEISWIDKSAKTAEIGAFAPVNLAVPGRTMLLSLGHVFNVEPWSGQSPSQFPKRDDMAVFADLSTVDRPLLLRKVTKGDCIHPLGMLQTVSLKKYLRSNSALTNNLKCWQGLVVADQSEVLWVPGVGLSEKIRVRTNPTHHLSISAITPDFLLA